MNEIVKKTLSEGDKFMFENHLRKPAALGKPEFTYSACGSFTKNKGRIQKYKERGNSRYVYTNELDKAYF